VKHEIPHDLDMETAKLAARKAVEAYGRRFEKYDFKSDWKSETSVDIAFEVKGKRLDGRFSVHAKKLLLELDVPFIFRVFSGRAIEIIETEARLWLDKAQRGELDSELA
jgi:hypothetical protein